MGWLWKNFEGFDCTKKVLVLFFRTKFCVATRFYLPDMKFISLCKSLARTWKLRKVRNYLTKYKESFPEELVTKVCNKERLRAKGRSYTMRENRSSFIII